MIKLKPSELTDEFYARLKLMVKNSINLTIRIDTTPEQEIELNKRLGQLKEGK